MHPPIGLLLLAAFLAIPGSLAAQDFEKAVVKTIPVSGNVAMLDGAGGNIGVISGPDGILIIDDQYAPMAPKLRAALAALAPDQPVRYILNTHWHGDHAGGNEAFSNQTGAIIVAHENVRKRLSTDQFIAAFKDTVRASAKAAWPVITFTETVTFYVNGDTVQVMHAASAHTDGDAIIRFKHANVIHAGDTFFNGFYPFIDVSSGGSLDGMIANAKHLLTLADANTKIIPGHGPLGDRAALQVYHDVLVGVRKNVAAAMQGGKSLSEVVKAAPTKPWDATWGTGFLNAETFTTLVYEDLKRTVK